MRAILVAAVLCGCGMRVTHREIAARTFSIRADKGDSSGEVLEAMHVEAGKVCPSGYDVIDSTTGEQTSGGTNPATGKVQVGTSSDGGMIVRCK